MNKKTMSGIIGLAVLLSVFNVAYADETASSSLDLPLVPIIEATSTDPGITFDISTSTSATTTDTVATTTDTIATTTVETASSTTPTDTSTSTPVSTSIHLLIKTPAETLFDNTLSVTPCQATTTAPLETTGYCAVMQSGVTVQWNWTWYESMGLMLNSLGGYVGDWTNYWSWYSNWDFGLSSLDKHTLTTGENLILTYGISPLKIKTSTSTIEQNSTSTISIEQPGTDENWNSIWIPAASSTLTINGVNFPIASSTVEFSTSTPGTYTFQARADTFVTSNTVTITVLASTTSSTTDQTSNSTENNGTGSTHSGPTFDLDKAIQFLVSQQQADGSFGGSLYTDWSAIALAATNQTAAKQKLASHLTSTPYLGSVVQDSERHAMALMALGINPSTGTSIDYIKKITDSFDGTQIGDPSIFNDDIFALFPLLKTGYTASDPIISKTVQFILSKQSSNGMWMSPDVTAAGIQALVQVQTLTGVSQAITQARNYLHSVENQGSFGSSYTTSWVLQAIASLNETPNQWSQNNVTPLNFLASYQQQDGGIEQSTDIQNRIWATAYAIPAASSKTWPSLLTSFARPAQSSATGSQASSTNPTQATTTATSTTRLTVESHSTSTATTSVPTTRTLPILKTVKTQARYPAVTSTETSGIIASSTSTSSTTIPDIQDTQSESGATTQFAAAQSGFGAKFPFIVTVLSLAIFAIGFGIYRYQK